MIDWRSRHWIIGHRSVGVDVSRVYSDVGASMIAIGSSGSRLQPDVPIPRMILCPDKDEGPQLRKRLRAMVDAGPVSRILYGVAAVDGHSSRPAIAGRLKRPTRKFGAPSRHAFGDRNRQNPPLFGLAPRGVCHAPDIAARAVRSYRTFSPLPRPCGRGGIFSVALSVQRP